MVEFLSLIVYHFILENEKEIYLRSDNSYAMNDRICHSFMRHSLNTNSAPTRKLRKINEIDYRKHNQQPPYIKAKIYSTK